MSGDLVAKASVTVDATRADAWKAPVDSATVEKYMFGATARSASKETAVGYSVVLLARA